MSKKYDLGGAYKGNGLTIYNRAEEEHGDYKSIAHISDSGVVTYYSKDLPQAVIDYIENEVKQVKPNN
jgi:hypothetical protein